MLIIDQLDILKDMIVEFGEPSYYWLPVRIVVNDSELLFKSSAVLLEPVTELAKALKEVVMGPDEVKVTMYWWLEPEYYDFCFCRKDTQYKLTIWYIDDDYAGYRERRTMHSEITGSVNDIILPFYRAIKKFASYAYAETHWPALDSIKITRLTQIIKGRKA
ncbi:hypothetical protein [Hymenobacter guriensis]|uniref:Uncharacterized protein n=1 Tax=Hymenobacter guriensis TaxID=2793065 RepID=A0ABS0KZZ0_9BACT|nr:hypothetical protein [Hymenobacter guriensis]MBG8552913.1 hypothetical protein [Hymenobacter guriensis]